MHNWVIACFDGLQAHNFSATGPVQEMQRLGRLPSWLKGSQAKLVGSLLTDMEAALVLQGLDDLLHKAIAEARLVLLAVTLLRLSIKT